MHDNITAMSGARVKWTSISAPLIAVPRISLVYHAFRSVYSIFAGSFPIFLLLGVR